MNLTLKTFFFLIYFRNEMKVPMDLLQGVEDVIESDDLGGLEVEGGSEFLRN